MTLLLTPAGYGKTLLLREALKAGEGGAWITLAAEHGDRNCLLAELEATAGAAPGPEGTAASPWARLKSVAERLARLGTPLFLDQVERLQSKESLDLLSRLIGLVAPQVHVVVAARGEPDLDLWELRLRGWVRLLGVADIRFSDAEMRALLEAWTGDPVEPRRLEWLGGWPAGAALLADEPRAVIDALARGEDVFPAAAARYLEQALLEPEPEEVRNLLMRLGVLQRIDPELLASLFDSGVPWTAIDSLARRFTFMEPDPDTGGYILQPVFAAFLRRRLEHGDTVAADAFKAQAAEWLWMLGRANEAIQLAGRIAEPRLAAAILERMQAWRLGISEGQACITGSPNPERLTGHFPSLALARSYGAARRGDIPAARADLARLKETLAEAPDQADGGLLSFVAAMDVIAAISEDLPLAADTHDMLQGLIDEAAGDEVSAGPAAILLSVALLGEGRTADAAAVARARLVRLLRLDNLHSGQLPIFLHTQVAMASLGLGRMAEAVENAEAAWRIGAEDPTIDAYELMISRIARCILHYEMDELEPARDLLRQALAAIESVNGWFELYAGLFDAAAALEGLEGDMDGVERVLIEADALARQRRMPRVSQWTKVLRLREAIRTGDLRTAARIAESPDFPASDPPGPGHDAWRERVRVPAVLERARWLNAVGDREGALESLRSIEASPFLEGDRRLWLAHQVTAMSASFALRRSHAAVEHLTVILDCARTCGLTRRVRDRRDEILRVADWALANGRRLSPANLSFLQKLEQAVPARPAKGRRPAPHSPQAAGGATLSLRESGILALIADGCSTKEIASRLNIAESTVKSHRKKLHEKLGAGSRSQVLARAREMLLL